MKFLRLAFLLLLPLAASAAWTPEQVEFFEKRIRPVLVQECYECHSTTGKRKGGLALDSRPAWQEGGDTGPAIVPGNLKESFLLRTIRHEEPDAKMPRNGAKLEDRVIRDFEKWIEMGAPDPRDNRRPTRKWPRISSGARCWSAAAAGGAFSRSLIHQSRAPSEPVWSSQPIDRFLGAKMQAAQLTPAPEGDPRLVLRRLSYVLTGLPPSPEETEAFVAAAQQNLPSAVEAAADRLLASPRFGECWARHWMDWVRYAESHGSEGDPLIPFAWRYRDYLIRALNADVSFPAIVARAHCRRFAGHTPPRSRARDQRIRPRCGALPHGAARLHSHGCPR